MELDLNRLKALGNIELQKLDDEIKKLESDDNSVLKLSISEIQTKIQDSSNIVGQLKRKSLNLEQQHKNKIETYDNLNQKYDKLNKQNEEISKSIEEYTSKINNLQKEIEDSKQFQEKLLLQKEKQIEIFEQTKRDNEKKKQEFIEMESNIASTYKEFEDKISNIHKQNQMKYREINHKISDIRFSIIGDNSNDLYKEHRVNLLSIMTQNLHNVKLLHNNSGSTLFEKLVKSIGLDFNIIKKDIDNRTKANNFNFDVYIKNTFKPLLIENNNYKKIEKYIEHPIIKEIIVTSKSIDDLMKTFRMDFNYINPIDYQNDANRKNEIKGTSKVLDDYKLELDSYNKISNDILLKLEEKLKELHTETVVNDNLYQVFYNECQKIFPTILMHIEQISNFHSNYFNSHNENRSYNLYLYNELELQTNSMFILDIKELFSDTPLKDKNIPDILLYHQINSNLQDLDKNRESLEQIKAGTYFKRGTPSQLQEKATQQIKNNVNLYKNEYELLTDNFVNKLKIILLYLTLRNIKQNISKSIIEPPTEPKEKIPTPYVYRENLIEFFILIDFLGNNGQLKLMH